MTNDFFLIMKSKILLFLILITYILTAVTISSVETGTCTDKTYTFVIKANSDASLSTGSATVTLASPENTTPTCTYGAVTSTQSGSDSSSGGGNTGGSDSGDANEDDSDNDGGHDGNEDSGNAGDSADDDAVGARRLATGDFDITCKITSKLENADIKVQKVVIGTTEASVANNGNYPVTMTGKANCEGTPDSNPSQFIQISGLLFLLILTIF